MAAKAPRPSRRPTSTRTFNLIHYKATEVAGDTPITTKVPQENKDTAKYRKMVRERGGGGKGAGGSGFRDEDMRRDARRRRRGGD